MSLTTILADIHVAIDPIIAAAKEWAVKAANFLADVPIKAGQKAVALVKKTALGVAIMNLISAAESHGGTGLDKFNAVLAAGRKLYDTFVGHGGLTGLIAVGVDVFREVIESLVSDFRAAS
jgi:hypothetical protein